MSGLPELTGLSQLGPTLPQIIAALIGFLAGMLSLFLLRVVPQRERIRALQLDLDTEKRIFEEKIRLLDASKQERDDHFTALSRTALERNNEAFLQLARESFGKLQIQAHGELEKREQAISGMIDPIRETLAKTEKQIQEMEKERKEAFGSLSQQLQMMVSIHQQLQTETRHLTQALKRPEVRGRWGELTLRRLVELAGMVEWCDFAEQQESLDENQRRYRPDMIIKLPNDRTIIIDAKASLDAYLKAVEAESDADKAHWLEHHAKKIRERVRELTQKSYWKQFEHSPDFVVMFIPGDQFLTAALDRDPALIEEAIQNKVIIATPMTLVALLRAVAYGWRQESIAANAEEIKELGQQLYDRFAVFMDHLAGVGKHLNRSVDQYNKTLGSLDHKLMPTLRRFETLGIHGKSRPESIDPIDQLARTASSEDEHEKR